MNDKKYFGTDGVRGRANVHPMTAEVALRLAMAAGRHFRRGEHRHRVIVGKDTRRSNYMIENALTAGLSSMGMDVFLLGPLQTAGVAMLTRTLRADVGIMITASHNPYYDNGIKLIGPDGYKLSDEVEAQIEEYMGEPAEPHLSRPDDIGHVQRLKAGSARYIEYAKATFPRALRLDGLKVVVDCANGAAYRTAPQVLWELGAEVIPLGVEPDGFNINKNCGSTAPQVAQQVVVENEADLGITLDGDADRLHIIDEKGGLVDGDQILATIAGNLAKRNRLKGNSVVGTVMSNLGLEQYLKEMGYGLERTRVGDRYVIERMREKGCNLGGEQSGHIMLGDYVTTGDGVIVALQVLAAMVTSEKPASEACRPFEPRPQVLRNVRANGLAVLEDPSVRSVIEQMEAKLGDGGRIVVRSSGTEPLIRVMAQGEDSSVLVAAVKEICGEIVRATG